jgi:cytochrome c553
MTPYARFPGFSFAGQRRAAVLLCMVLASAAPAWAQNAVAGKALFEDTINATSINTLTGNCTSCHASVQERRTQIGGSPFAEISLTLATNRLGTAIASQSSMRQFQALSAEQIQDIAAYIADTPEVSTDQLDFTAPAVNTFTTSQFVELRNSKAAPATETLRIVKVEITGTAASRYRRSSDTCDQATLAVGGSCRVTVDFSAPDTTTTIVPLVFTLRQGASTTTFSRTVMLNGAVAVAAPPGGAASGSDSGGGAMGWPWLLALGVATGLLLVLRLRADWPVVARHKKRAAQRQ